MATARTKTFDLKFFPFWKYTQSFFGLFSDCFVWIVSIENSCQEKSVELVAKNCLDYQHQGTSNLNQSILETPNIT